MNKTKSKSTDKVIINNISFKKRIKYLSIQSLGECRRQLAIQRFILILAFYSHFSVLSPFQRFIPISVSVFSFRFSDSVSAFYPDPDLTDFFFNVIILIINVLKAFAILYFSLFSGSFAIVCFSNSLTKRIEMALNSLKLTCIQDTLRSSHS